MMHHIICTEMVHDQRDEFRVVQVVRARGRRARAAAAWRRPVDADESERDVSVPNARPSICYIWTIIRHDGPNHLGL